MAHAGVYSRLSELARISMKSKSNAYSPMARFVDVMPERSGNDVNGLGESAERQATPFFWHPPERQSHGALQKAVIDYLQQSPEMAKHFSPKPPGGRGPAAATKSVQRVEHGAADWTDEVKAFALRHEADIVGIAAIDPLFVYQGYEIKEPWVILVGVVMDHDQLAKAPPTFEDPSAGVVVGQAYNRAARACRELANHILSQGYYAKAYQGPYASALNMLPAAIAAGMGELGKHGSLIHREYGSSLRLSAVTTDLPLVADTPDKFGADDYCARCQACTRACPPGAISDLKQLVRGVEKWYVDFDKCIPYFGETFGCGICIAICPWSRPGVAGKLLKKLTRTRPAT